MDIQEAIKLLEENGYGIIKPKGQIVLENYGKYPKESYEYFRKYEKFMDQPYESLISDSPL